MKKLAKLAALLAAAALLFGAVGCSGGDDDDPPAKTLEGIKITADDTVKTQYDVNAELDLLTGVKVTAEYSDKSEENVTDKADITATYKDAGTDKPFDTKTKGIFHVTLAASYEGKEATLEEPITITVGVELASISMEVVGDVKTTYKQGEPIDPTGIKVTAHYDTGSESALSNSEVEFTATYKVGDEDKPFTTDLEPGDYNSVTLIATYKGKTAELRAPTITIVENDGGEDSGDGDDDGKETYFKSFVASDDLGVDTDSSSYTTFTSKDELVKILGRAKYQINEWNTADYDETAGTGYTYTARVKINATNKDGEGKLTITKVKIGDVLRIDGGNANPDVRKMSITGANKTEWEASAQGSFYLTATAETVVLESMTNEFCIYGIHVVDEEVEESVTDTTTTYEKPVVELSADSVAKDDSEGVTVNVTIPQSTTKTIYSTGKVETTKADVTAEITYEGATVTDGKVDISSVEAGDSLTITASYTAGGETYTSEPVTLKVTAGFESKEETVPNDEDTLGLVATPGTADTSDKTVATAEIDSNNITITSHKKGTATITVSDGTNKATIDVTVDADGSITPKVHKYGEATEDSWTITTEAYTAISSATANYEMKGAKNALTATFYKSGAKGHGKTTTSNNVSYAGYGSWAASPAISGGKVKNDFLKISDIKGAVTLTVKWAMNSAQSAGNRNLEVTVGDDKEKCVATPCDANKGAQADYVVNFDAGDGTNVYIGASNEICLVSVTIEAQK